MENLIENNENTDNGEGVQIIKPILLQQQQQQQQEALETENNVQLQEQQQQQPPQVDVQKQLQQQQQQQQQEAEVGITKQIETTGEKKTIEQPLLAEEFEGEEDDDEDDDDDDDDEEKEISQKLIIDIPDEDEEEEDEDDDVIALDDLPMETVLLPNKENSENAKNIVKQPAEVETIITLSDGEEDIPAANEVAAKPGKVQKRRSIGSNAAAGNDEERFRLKRRKINVEGAPKMPLTGYVRYMHDRRESLRKEQPTKTAMEHTKMIGEEWHSLPADIKASYLKAADADKQRYVKELDIFLKSRPDVLASELAKNKARKNVENNSPNPSTIAAAIATTAATITAAGATVNKQQQQQQQQQQVLKDKLQNPENAAIKSTKEPMIKEKTQIAKEMAPMPSTSQQALDNHKTGQEKNKRKRTPTPPTSTTTATTTTTATASSATPATVTNTNAFNSNAMAGSTVPTTATSSSASAIVMPAPGEIPIFTNEFLEHNKIYDMELRSLRKSKTDLEQQNSVLEKHVENMKFGVEKMITENNELEEKNRLLEIYLDKLKRKLALALAALPLPSAPNGATVDNIDKYMQDLYKMSTSNSHGPATLNKAKDIIRKLDLQIQL